ncbi:MAG: monovalent cation/H+ antiporter complex subunit F [Bacillota bacterium]
MTELAFTMVVVAAALCLIRVVQGPGLVDRLAAADALGVMLAAAIVLFGVMEGLHYLLDVGFAYAVLLFVDVLLIGKYLEKGDLHR